MRMTPIIIFVFFLILIEVYAFFGLRASLFVDKSIVFSIAYILTTLITIVGVLVMFRAFANLPTNQSFLLNFIIGLVFSFIVAKLHFSVMLLFEDVLRGFLWLFQSVFNFRLVESISRSYIWGLFLFSSGVMLALLLNYGVWFGKYHYKVHHHILYFSNLPESFDGFKIGQLSDLHLGTFDNFKRVKKGLNLLQNEQPDVIVLTGDMVNNKADEALLYVDVFKQLSAPFGKYTIMGNHDYGDYTRWNSKEERQGNIVKLETIGKQMGLTWLNNLNIPIEKNGDIIYLAGVENWGEPPFPQYGDLNKALDGLKKDDFVVLLSHDPTHWRKEVLKIASNVALTLSGHTHGMQFGIELGKFKWSPVKYKYKDWADLHESKGQFLYVNRGFGNIGYPGRVGIRPEITIIELRKK